MAELGFEVAYFDDEEDARKEVQRRKISASGNEILVKMLSSGYGGYKVISIPIDMLLDQIIDSPFSQPLISFGTDRPRKYGNG